MNTTTRLGKIARLPHSIREQLNLKLHDNVPAKSILPWLNSLPEVKAILATDFDNRPINKQNLSEWRQGGFRDWLLQFQAAHFLQFTDTHSPALRSAFDEGGSSIPAPPNSESPSSIQNPASAIQNPVHKLLLWTQLQYISMARHIDSESDPDRKWTALRHFANDISRLKRSSLADDYLQIQRDWLALSQSNTADKKEKDFWNWTKRPDIEKKLFPDRRPGLTPEQLYQFEKDTCLLDGPGPEIAELMAEVRIAKKLLELRKAKEAEAKAKAEPDYDPERPLPDTKVRLAGMPFEELFPTIPEKPLTETHPELDDALPDVSADHAIPTHSSHQSHSSHKSHNNPPSPTLRSPSSEVHLTKEDASDEGGPALHSAFGEGGSDTSCQSDTSASVQPGPAQSSQIQPESPLDSEPNPNSSNLF